MTARIALLLAFVLGATAARGEEEPVILEHDPFARPAALAGAAPGSGASRASAASLGSAELRATVVAGSESMANVDGVIVKMGEELNGYRLVEVGDRRAVFEREGARRILYMD